MGNDIAVLTPIQSLTKPEHSRRTSIGATENASTENASMLRICRNRKCKCEKGKRGLSSAM